MAATKNSVTWFEIYVNDMARARKFYETVLAVTLTDMQVPGDADGAGMQMVAFPYVDDAPNAAGALVQADSIKAGGNSTLVYFTCVDCAVEEARVEKAGGKVTQPKMPIGAFGFCSIIEDTEGNQVGLHSLQ